jgi:predicted nucleic acid-binding protein
VIVFSNTTPFIALASIDQLDLMPRLFGRIHVVSEVIEECAAGGTIPVPDLRKLNWIHEVQSEPIAHSSVLIELDRGEKHTVDMALRLNADWVLIDEKLARNLADYLGLKVTGTLGLLLKARQNGWIGSFTLAVRQMTEQGIRFHPQLIEKLARSIGEA